MALVLGKTLLGDGRAAAEAWDLRSGSVHQILCQFGGWMLMDDALVRTDQDVISAFELLRKITPEHELLQLAPTGPAAVYTTLVTLWMVTLQRLAGGMSLSGAVKEVLEHSRHLLPDNKRVREGTLSENSGTYSEARKRLPRTAVELFATRVCESLIERTPSWFGDRRAFLIDGTTITLPPTSELKRVYPPATNQHGESVWPVLMLLVAHELQTGCALIPELGAMYGPDNTSEAQQAARLAPRIPPGSIVLSDAAFGIFYVAWKMRQQGHEVLFRLSASRFHSLVRKLTPSHQAPGETTWQLQWKPSARERHNHPDLPADAALDVLVHAVLLDNGEHLYLVTSLPWSAAQAADGYARRYDVEHNIRDFKVTLRVETIRAKSEEMVFKELLCSIVAYNLLLEFRRKAAAVARVPPRRLSFTQVWNTFEISLLRQPPAPPEEWQARYDRALAQAARARLPNRPGRSYPRRAHPRRPKSTKFMHSKPPPTTK
jgi:hypothetical protein